MKNKTCKYCKEQIDSKAKVCSKCGKDQRNWFLRHPIISSILVLSLLTMMFGSSSDTSKDTKEVSKSKATTEQVVVHKVSVFDIGDAFNANQVSAEKEWNGKYIEFSAEISNITDGGISFYNVSSDDFDMTSIRCNLTDENQLLDVKNGQTITVQGVIQGQSLGVIRLEDCEVVDEKTSKGMERTAIAGGDDLEELTDFSVNVWTSYSDSGLEAPIKKIPNKSEVTVLDEIQATNANGHQVTYYKIKYGDIEGWVGQNIITFK